MTTPANAANRLSHLLDDDKSLLSILGKHAERGNDRRFDVQPLQPGAAKQDSTEHGTATDAASAWHAAQPVQGWVLYQSGQAAFSATHPLPDTAAWGALLAAEAVNAQGHSLRLARNATGRWVLTRTTHEPQGEGVWDEVRHLASAESFGALVYRRYWGIDAQGNLAVQSAHFIGYTANL